MAEKRLLVEVVTPYDLFYKAYADMVIFTAKDGEVGIMPGHAPLIAALVSGEIRIKTDDNWLTIASTNGYAEVGPEICLLIVNAAEYPADINLERAKKSLARAEAKIQDPLVSRQEKNHARHAIERAKNRIKIALRYQAEQQKTKKYDNSFMDID